MTELVFGMELRGNAALVAGTEDTFKASTSGTGPNGEAVSFESYVVMSAEGFRESGVIEYGGRGKLTFETVGIGYLGPSADSNMQAGAVIWRITEGEGQFQGASGYITSNFTFSSTGQVVDDQYVRMFVP